MSSLIGNFNNGFIIIDKFANEFKNLFQVKYYLKSYLFVIINNKIPPQFQVVKKQKVERRTKYDIVAFRAHIRFTLLIEKYREFQMGSNDTILQKIG